MFFKSKNTAAALSTRIAEKLSMTDPASEKLSASWRPRTNLRCWPITVLEASADKRSFKPRAIPLCKVSVNTGPHGGDLEAELRHRRNRDSLLQEDHDDEVQ